MKKSLLSLAVAAGAAGLMSTAHADMYINEDGLGEVLIYPFYSAQNGNDTLINVVNTTGITKAVKVRILEAENSAEVIDFNLYLSPEDHFSFAITATADGGAELRTIDTSCTVPAIPTATGNSYKSVAFRNFQYDDDKATGTAAFDNTSISRTQIGYVEIFEMGQIVNSSASGVDIKHGATTGVPADCAQLTKNWSTGGTGTGLWASASPSFAPADFETTWGSNGGGLYGYGTVINVADGTAFGFDAVAIDDAVQDTLSGGVLHYAPGDLRPGINLISPDPFVDTAIVNVNGQAIPNQFSALTVGTAVVQASTLAFNSLFQTTEVINDFIIDPALNATTDWIITMPTKRPHVNGVTAALPPFSDLWDGKNACEGVTFSYVDREERVRVPDPSGPDFSPRPDSAAPTDFALCYESTVVQMGASSTVKAADVVTSLNAELTRTDEGAAYTEGWAAINLDGTGLATDVSARRTVVPVNTGVGVAQDGLPVTGFAAIKYTNGALAGGTLANYAFATEHKTTTVTSSI